MDIVLFVLFTAFYAARWIFFFDNARRIFGHSVASMYLGAIPMGLATIINGFLVFGLALWGKPAVSMAHALWWADVAMSLSCGLLVPFLMFTLQHHSIKRMTAVWLLPHRGDRGRSGQRRFARSAPPGFGSLRCIDSQLRALGVLRPVGDERTRDPADTPCPAQVT